MSDIERYCENPWHRTVFGQTQPGICPTCGLPIGKSAFEQAAEEMAQKAKERWNYEAIRNLVPKSVLSVDEAYDSQNP